MIEHIEEFKQEAVRIALSSGLPRDRVASDRGSGSRRWASAWRSIGRPIWHARMNASALKTVCSGRRGQC